MTPTPKAIAPITDTAVLDELLHMTLRNAGRSVPLLLAAVAWFVWLGMQADRPLAAVAVGLLGCAVGLWRLSTARRFAHPQTFDAGKSSRAMREVEGNAALAGLMWAVATVGIYPRLTGASEAVFLLILTGSLALAALFMSLVGRSFL
ncbi:MAG: hybrid sensor histidine kinase/response regulator, partial [Burkholderiaceae bacterium]|nr:hybrid sensor histidine kinase/response regulator [Burkholderiaceae bacterium]